MAHMPDDLQRAGSIQDSSSMDDILSFNPTNPRRLSSNNAPDFLQTTIAPGNENIDSMFDIASHHQPGANAIINLDTSLNSNNTRDQWGENFVQALFEGETSAGFKDNLHRFDPDTLESAPGHPPSAADQGNTYE